MSNYLLYWYKRVGWDKPVLVKVYGKGKENLYIEFEDGTILYWKDIPDDAQFLAV